MSNSEKIRPVSRVAAILSECQWKPRPTFLALRQRPNGQPDFIVRDEGTFWTFRARSQAAKAWWIENVNDGPSVGCHCYLGQRSAQAIVELLKRDGFASVDGRA